ncbi:MAG: LTA synthase family protein [Methylovulum sp.]|nr:LTA synthase family protein [Methylovulum sp.]
MIDMTFFSLLLMPMLVGLIVSCVLEQRAQAGAVALIWRRPLAALLLHTGSWLVLFTSALLVLQRPWFAVFLVLAFQILLILVNQAKFNSLREPFIFQDFEYFTDAIKHPRLYLPFFGVARTLAATFGFAGALSIGLVYEAPITDALPLPLLITSWLSLLLMGMALVHQGLRRCPTVIYDPAKDLYDLGQVAFFWAYWQAETVPIAAFAPTFFHRPPTVTDTSKQPDIVAIQSESFFDPRSLSGLIKPTVLEHFDQIKATASHHGRLFVPAWGANTVRTECGFLSALSPEQLGIHRFNPYRLLAKQSIPNLASYLKQSGYRTLCIHPYPASFYLRNKVFPLMGFDEFMDIDSFNAGQKSGQFVGDLAVADKVNGLLNSGLDTTDEGVRKPLFIFVITMENHGPLHLEQPNDADVEAFYQQPPAPGSADLTVYLRHLKNADLMIKSLREGLSCRAEKYGQEGVLCWYGDHVPIMPTVYELFAEPDGLTDYFIWATAPLSAPSATNTQPLSIDALGALVLKSAALV